jgi:hypothetical protein
MEIQYAVAYSLKGVVPQLGYWARDWPTPHRKKNGLLWNVAHLDGKYKKQCRENFSRWGNLPFRKRRMNVMADAGLWMAWEVTVLTCSTVLLTPFCVLLTRSSILSTRSSVLFTCSNVLLTCSSILLTPSCVMLTRSGTLSTRSSVLFTRSSIVLTRIRCRITWPLLNSGYRLYVDAERRRENKGAQHGLRWRLW